MSFTDGWATDGLSSGLRGGVSLGRAIQDGMEERANRKADKSPLDAGKLQPAVAQGVNSTLALTPGSEQLPSASSMGFGKEESGGTWGALGGMVEKISGALGKSTIAGKAGGDLLGKSVAGGLLKGGLGSTIIGSL